MLRLRRDMMVLTVGAALLWGCGPGEAIDESLMEEALMTSNQELSSEGPFNWQQGSASIPVGSSTGRVCYLTRMAGKFKGSGESIHAFVDGGSWYLGGASQQRDVVASVHCSSIPNGSYSNEYSWNQGQSPTYLGPSSGRACFLTRVSGKFFGTGEWVHVYQVGGSWFVGGSSMQAGVAASARCVDVPSYTPNEYIWKQGWNATYMETTPNRSCALTYVSGRFEGGGESVNIFQYGGSWYLGGISQQWGVQARATCF